MMHNVTISPDVYTALRQRAQQAKTSLDKVVDELLRSYFSREEQAWQRAFESLVARVQARTTLFNSAEIEADITAAADEHLASRC